jgi:hypothetical protein
VRGRLEDITGIGIDEDSIVAEAVCGTFYIHNHDVSLTIGHIVRWLLDVIVTAVTEGEYTSLEDILGELVYVCGDIASFVDELAWELASGLDISLPDVYDLVERSCEAGVEAGIEAAMDWIEDLQVSSDMLRLGGHARIESARRLADGVWLGEILGNDFSGEFTADRRR